MTLQMDRAKLVRLNKDIADLRDKEAKAAKKAADAQKKMLSAQASAAKARSDSMARSHQSTADRESRALQSAQAEQVRFAGQLAAKTKELAGVQERIAREEDRQRRASDAAADKRQRDDARQQRIDASRQAAAAAARAESERAMQQRISDLEAQLAAQLEASAAGTPTFTLEPPVGEDEIYDVFISHASEDKEDFVDEFATKARAAGLRVWYDRFSLQWGDSLRESIDRGLRSSLFGVAVLSPSFFSKDWTRYELDGLVERMLDGSSRLLPIWHRLTRDDVSRHAPSLANRLALTTANMSVDAIVHELVILRDAYRGRTPDAP